jgi:hypothetical protein
MAVHTPSLFGAIVLVIVAFLLLELIGLGGLLLLIVAVVLLYWAFGPGSRRGGL